MCHQQITWTIYLLKILVNHWFKWWRKVDQGNYLGLFLATDQLFFTVIFWIYNFMYMHCKKFVSKKKCCLRDKCLYSTTLILLNFVGPPTDNTFSILLIYLYLIQRFFQTNSTVLINILIINATCNCHITKMVYKYLINIWYKKNI